MGAPPSWSFTPTGRLSVLVPNYFLRTGPLAWSPDGTTLAGIAHNDIAAFNSSDGTCLWRAQAGGRRAFTSLAFHPSSRSLLVGVRRDRRSTMRQPGRRRGLTCGMWGRFCRSRSPRMGAWLQPAAKRDR